MEKQSIIKKITHFLANLFKVIIIMILNIIRGIFGKSKITNENKYIKDINNITDNSNNGVKPIHSGNSNTGLPDEDNIKNNNHDTSDNDSNATNDVMLELPKYKLNNLNKRIDDDKVDILTFKFVSELIDLELEEIYKEQKFKVKDAPKDIEEKINELKKKIIPKIVEKINDNKLVTKDEVKKEVKKTLEEELKEKPILKVEVKEEVDSLEDTSLNKNNNVDLTPKIEDVTNKEEDVKSSLLERTTQEVKDSFKVGESKKEVSSPTLDLPIKRNENEYRNDCNKKEDIYFLAIPRKKELKLHENKPNKANKRDKLVTLDNSTPLKEKLDETPIKMVQNVDVVPKPSTKETLANAAIATTVIAADITREMFGSAKKEKQEEPTTLNRNDGIKSNDSFSEEVRDVQEVTAETLDIKGVSSIERTKEELDQDTKSVQEIAQLQAELEEKIEQIKKEDKKETSKQEETIVKDLMKDAEISAITQTSEAIIEESTQEAKKEEFEDKDYDRIERQLDKMLEDISNTYLRYEDKMTPKQKAKLEAEENKLRYAKDHIMACRDKDIAVEQRLLSAEITSREITGLQEELKKLDVQNRIEANEALLKKLDNMEGMTREQVANVDKRILTKRLRKASLLLEMTSLLAFPFIRNKYFMFFTAGLLIDNHFNFINAFFRRKVNRYDPVDLAQIRKGQDALDGALDVTYKNLVELDYIEQQTLAKYPELANDPQFVNQIMHLRTKLNQNYNKLMRKNKVMEKYYYRSKQQKKILKKDLKPDHS